MNYKYKKKRYQQSNKRTVWFVVFIFTVLIMGTATYAYFKRSFSVATLEEQAALKVSTRFSQMFHKQKKQPQPKKLAANPPEAIKPIHFDFYDELPKAQMEPSANESFEEEEASASQPATIAAVVKKPAASTPAAISAPAPVPVLAKKNQSDEEFEKNVAQELASDLSAIQGTETSPYILQLSVFHSLEAANRYRAALVSAGLKVEVVKLRIGKEVVYRLQQGPYYNLNELKLAKKRLTERGIACDVRKLAPYTM